MTTENLSIIPTGTKAQREAWLTKATRRITKKWAKLGVAVPADVQLSCGFPGGGSPQRRIGECWPRARSAHGVNQVFINPTVSEPVLALDVLGHELLHAVDNCKDGHGHQFSRLSAMVGYSGGKHSKAVSQGALKLIAQLTKALGPYPHGALVLAPKKQKANSGLHKYECLGDAAYSNEHSDVLYSTEKMIEDNGAPKCRICGAQMEHAKRKRKPVVETI